MSIPQGTCFSQRSLVAVEAVATGAGGAGGGGGTMVKTFQAYLPPCHRTYSCIHCRAHLASHDELISKVRHYHKFSPSMQTLTGYIIASERTTPFQGSVSLHQPYKIEYDGKINTLTSTNHCIPEILGLAFAIKTFAFSDSSSYIGNSLLHTLE